MFLTYLIAQAQTNVPQQVVDKVVESNLPTTEAAPVVAQNFSIWSHLSNSDPIVQLTLFILILFSVGCWAVILFKMRQIKTAQKSSEVFWDNFSTAPSLSDIVGKKDMRNGPMYEIYRTGHDSLSRIKKVTNNYSPYYREALHQRLRQTQEEEVGKLEQYVGFLATTASVAPFIGLFGTVWGILTAFLAIGKAGSSSLATVGPYIAEALVATAVGLFAAIPAVVAYNYFVGKIKKIRKLIELFMQDFMLKSEKEMAS